MKFKHIIWDYDGTLFDSYPVVVAAFNEILIKYDIVEDINEIYSHMKISLSHANEYYREKHDLDDVFFEQYKNLKTIYDREKTKPFDGAVELCEAICTFGGKNYLYTHRDNSAVESINKHDMANFFTESITSQQQFTPKPSPDAILYLLEKYKFPPDEAIMIGDRGIDIISGKNAGIYSCYFSGDNGKYDVADYNAKNFSELFEVLGVG